MEWMLCSSQVFGLATTNMAFQHSGLTVSTGIDSAGRCSDSQFQLVLLSLDWIALVARE